jgi:hypothetical protein
MWIYHTAIAISATLENSENSSQFAIAGSDPSGSPPLDDHPIKLGWILLNQRLISPPQLESALTHQHHCQRKLGELLMEANLLSNEQLERALQEQHWRRKGYWVI